MTQPLALIFYERLMPGSQLVNRLQDLGYRVQTLAAGQRLVEQAQTEKPLLVIMDLTARQAEMCAVIKEMKSNPPTSHIPVLAVATDQSNEFQAAAREAGAALIASDQAILAQLPQLLEQTLRVE